MIADLAALYERRQLLGDFAWRELRARYKGSALGFAWNFFIPLLQLVVFTILFGVLLRTPSRTATGDQPYAIFLFAGLVPWTFFASSLQGGAASVVANGAIVKRVRMPVQLLPAASVLSALVNLVASTAVLLAVLAVFGPRHPEGLLWLPLLVAVQLALQVLMVDTRDAHRVAERASVDDDPRDHLGDQRGDHRSARGADDQLDRSVGSAAHDGGCHGRKRTLARLDRYAPGRLQSRR